MRVKTVPSKVHKMLARTFFNSLLSKFEATANNGHFLCIPSHKLPFAILQYLQCAVISHFFAEICLIFDTQV